MKKYTLFLVIVFLSIIFFYPFQNTRAQDNPKKTKVVLVNPYFEDVEDIIYFIENKLIDIPEVELIGIFYTKTSNDFDKINQLLKDQPHSYIHLEQIDSNLKEDELFQNNSLSEKFYNIFKESDGMLFFGGYDIPPSIYGQKTGFTTNINDPNRYYFELSLLFHLLGGSQNDDFRPYLEEKPNYVIQGYCLGMQSMNVATGGSLIQNTPNEIYGLDYVEEVLNLDHDKQHFQYYRSLTNDIKFRFNFHRISFTQSNLFNNAFQYDTTYHPFVYSNHKQSVLNLGKDFNIVATSMDKKVIEAITHNKYKNVLGLQFHPEIGELYKISDKKYKINPNDTSLISYNEFLQNNNSLKFHKDYWKYFSELFKK